MSRPVISFVPSLCLSAEVLRGREELPAGVTTQGDGSDVCMETGPSSRLLGPLCARNNGHLQVDVEVLHSCTDLADRDGDGESPSDQPECAQEADECVFSDLSEEPADEGDSASPPVVVPVLCSPNKLRLPTSSLGTEAEAQYKQNVDANPQDGSAEVQYKQTVDTNPQDGSTEVMPPQSLVMVSDKESPMKMSSVEEEVDTSAEQTLKKRLLDECEEANEELAALKQKELVSENVSEKDLCPV